MPKTTVFTTYTPLPSGITRKSVVDMYRDHLAMIDLNPLVVERYKCKTPSYAPTEEYYATWYTIKDKVSYLPGGLATGSVSYHAVFNDMPDSLETHIYAPLGLDIRGKWSVGGSLSSEPRRPSEAHAGAPRAGLYIKEEVRMTCSALLMRFVKKTFKDSHARLVEKLVERAHILESNFANERLKALRNVDPRDRMAHGSIFIAPPPGYQLSPPPYQSPRSPRTSHSRSQSATTLLTPGLSKSDSFPEKSPRLLSPSHTRSQSASPLLTPALSQPEEKRMHIPSPLFEQCLRSPRPSHTRSHSASPMVTPGLSSSGAERSMWLPSPSSDRPASSQSFHKPAIGQDEDMYLLPATTYNGGRESLQDRPISIYPANTFDMDAETFESSGSDESDGPDSPIPPHLTYYHEKALDDAMDEHKDNDSTSPEYSLPQSPDYVYEYKTISFNFAFNQSSPILPASSEDILADIDAAIDEAFVFTRNDAMSPILSPKSTIGPMSTFDTLPATTYNEKTTSSTQETLPATTYLSSTTYLSPTTYMPPAKPLSPIAALPSTTYLAPKAYYLSPTAYKSPRASQPILPATTYSKLPNTVYNAPLKRSASSGTILTSATYEPKKPLRERKDSVMPFSAMSEVPPVPPKDEKYLRGATSTGIAL